MFHGGHHPWGEESKPLINIPAARGVHSPLMAILSLTYVALDSTTHANGGTQHDREHKYSTSRWILGFFVEGMKGPPKYDPNYPLGVSFWQPDKETCITEGRRVLRELAETDARTWVAHGHPDPWLVGNGLVESDQWIERSDAEDSRDPDDDGYGSTSRVD